MVVTISATADGRPVFNFNNVQNYYVGGLGTMTGTGQVEIGTTSDDQTLFNFTKSNDNDFAFTGLNGTDENLAFHGDYYNVKTGNGSQAILWDVQGGNLDVGDGNDIVKTTHDSISNNITGGNGDKTITDHGYDNFFQLGAGRNLITLDNDSENAIVRTGFGPDMVRVLGATGADINTGGGNDSIVLDEDSSNNTVTGGTGNDTIVDLVRPGVHSTNDLIDLDGNNTILRGTREQVSRYINLSPFRLPTLRP